MSSTPKYRHGEPVPEELGDESKEYGATETPRDRIPVRGGLLVGAGAFLLNVLFAVIMVWTSRRGADSWGDIESPPGVLTETSWLFLSNHGAELNVGGDVGSFFGMWSYRIQNMSAAPIYTVFFLGIIVAAGYAVAECVSTDSRLERIGGALLVVPAYAVGAPALSVFATWEPPMDGEERVPELQEITMSAVDAAMFAGILVPTVLALLGGCLSVARRAWLQHRQSVAPRE
ncbi:hypothetical protein [Halovivax limisalsi]|uniref:hypothetical protein n=1 Tax=Halovivax limisalsi TaxID=1453760 RepID=UPI001FFC2D0D|nr:hypothetical protein [Halovivax limisalsi]